MKYKDWTPRMEDYIRLRFDNFPLTEFETYINDFSINFIREASNYIDIKRVLWNARPWDIIESIEEHMKHWHPQLKEFWKDILTDEEYNLKYFNL